MIRVRHFQSAARWLLVAGVLLGLVAYGLPANPASAEDEIVVTLRVAAKASSAEAIAASAAENDAVVIGELPPARGIYLVERDREVKPKDVAKKTEELADKLQKEDGISWAVPYEEDVGGTRFYAWNEDLRGRSSDGDVDLATSLDLATVHGTATGSGVTVALIDTGFDLDHPMLVGRLLSGVDVRDGHARVSDWKNGVDEDGDGLADESHGHGTFIAGVIAQIAPDAHILPIRAMEADGVGDMHVIIDAIDEAIVRGADVINVSFGTDTDSKGLKDAVKRAQKAGIVVVAAAGNHGSEVKRYPAAYSGVIAVGAFDGVQDRIADWGAFGDWIDVSAPGSKIVSAKPGGGVATWSGSSVSAPVVAAQVALLLEIDPEKAAKDAEKLVRDSAVKPQHERRSKSGLIQLLVALEELR